jgi:hypothetical protein
MGVGFVNEKLEHRLLGPAAHGNRSCSGADVQSLERTRRVR